jgi:inosine-uridine nucleoside N-ribohydrolase
MSPLIIDTDVGGDPDDAVALAVAALRVPDLALVITSDEFEGQRARFARHLLDQAGRADVPVVAGRQLGHTRYLCVDGLTPVAVADQPGEESLFAEVEAVCAGEGPVRWVGLGPMSNLAAVLARRPALADRLKVTQASGTQISRAVGRRHLRRAEHNLRLDPGAAHAVLAATCKVWLVTPETAGAPAAQTGDTMLPAPAAEITATGKIYRRLIDSDRPWARTLIAHLDQWFDRCYPVTRQHDPLTLAAALGLPFIDFDPGWVRLDEAGRLSEHRNAASEVSRQRAGEDGCAGAKVFLTVGADHPGFLRWLEEQLDTADAQAVTPLGPLR